MQEKDILTTFQGEIEDDEKWESTRNLLLEDLRYVTNMSTLYLLDFQYIISQILHVL